MPAALRNTLIIMGLAGAVYALPGGGDAANFVGSLLSTLLLVLIVFGGWRTYRENRVTFYSLGDTHRALMYGALGAAVVAAAGSQRMLDRGSSATSVFAWFVIAGGAVYAAMVVFRHWRTNV